MQALLRLLTLQDSPVTEALRQGLRGLSFQLRESLRQSPSDPGAADGKDLLDELTGLLEENSSSRSMTDLGAQFSAHREQRSLLSHLREEIEASRHLQERLGSIRLQGIADPELWGEIQRLFLRLNPAELQRWSQRAQELARQASAVPHAQDAVCLCDEADEEIYQGLAGTITAPGLKLSATAPLHPLLDDEFHTPETPCLAAGISFYLQFIELDATLHHALETVRPLGIHRLTGMHRDGFMKEMILRFQRVRKTAADPLGALHAWIALDEAVHSLLHLPPAGNKSWWRQHQQRCRQRLDIAAEKARHAGHRVHLRWLTGTYKQVRNYSTNDWGLESGGSPGEVLACLRVYAEIDGQAYPGRVIYRDY